MESVRVAKHTSLICSTGDLLLTGHFPRKLLPLAADPLALVLGISLLLLLFLLQPGLPRWVDSIR